ncbi:Dimethylaniline monooxygenase [Mycena kentingensis (nom. inval.)]|nr:Dimethylaniline monooxygenase [Mycena kentingensis (nom. inval.)]
MGSDSDAEYWDHFDEEDFQGAQLETAPLPATPQKQPLKRKTSAEVAYPAKRPNTTGSDGIRFFTSSSTAVIDDAQPFFIVGFKTSADAVKFEKLPKICTGARWELARLMSSRPIKGVPARDTVPVDLLRKLTGPSKEAAPTAAEIIDGRDPVKRFQSATAERKIHSPWEALDLEEHIMSVDPSANLGNSSEFPGYGGCVHFIGTLAFEANKFTINLECCETGASSRLYRKYGSSRFLRIRVPSQILHRGDERIQRFFRRPFVIFDEVYRAFHSKEGRVFLFKTGEKVKNGVVEGDDAALFEFLDEFNPLELNSDQALCKWASRFSLGLSNSVPGPIVLPECVDEFADIMSSAGSNMSDGCGLSNLVFNLQLQRDFKLDTMPCAVQVRHGGRKGMLLYSPDVKAELNNRPLIAFRNPSQVKIAYTPQAQADPANSTVELLRFSRTRTPARLSAEVIINLEHNGVPAEVFVRLQHAHLSAGVEGMLQWARGSSDGMDTMLELYAAVEKSEGVYAMRKSRQAAAGEARIRGHEKYGDDGIDAEAEDSIEDLLRKNEKSTAWWPDPVSGCPSSLSETVLALIDSGFTPRSLPILRDKLENIVRAKIKYRAEHFHYEVSQSASAFVVPDYLRVLGEEEIHFKSSRREFPQEGGMISDIVLGDVLMTRNPCKVPSDCRKIKAVRCKEYSDTLDVIVCSVAGKRRLLDFLAGGDYDGDKCIVIWDPTMVELFRNADDGYSIEPKSVAGAFTRDATTVATFLAENRDTSPKNKAEKLQKYLLGALRNPSDVGSYSGLHDNTVLSRGYGDAQTVELAYKFCKILDASKTGFDIKPDVRMQDRKKYGHAEGPAWKRSQKMASNYASTSNMQPLQRKIDATIPGIAKPFIMDVLVEAGEGVKGEWLREVEELFAPFKASDRSLFDHALARPWDDYLKFAKQRETEGDASPRKDLDTIAKHVERIFEQHREVIKQKYKKSSENKAVGFTTQPIEKRQDELRALSRDFASRPTPAELRTMPNYALIAQLRASYAYRYDCEKSYGGCSGFPWNVAFGELCAIKAESLGPRKTMPAVFYERMKLMGAPRPI